MHLSFELLAAGLSVANAQIDTGVLDPGRSAAGGDRRLSGECPEGFVTCVNGLVEDTEQTCAEACDGACCVGSVACDHFTGQVCKNYVSCMGDYVCFSANIGSVVNGCSGPDACYDSEIDSVVTGCQGDGACFDALISSELFYCCNADYACWEATSLPASCPAAEPDPQPDPQPPAGTCPVGVNTRSASCGDTCPSDLGDLTEEDCGALVAEIDTGDGLPLWYAGELRPGPDTSPGWEGIPGEPKGCLCDLGWNENDITSGTCYLNNPDSTDADAALPPDGYKLCRRTPPCPAGQTEAKVTVLTDNWPGETSWTLTNTCDGKVVLEVAAGNYDKELPGAKYDHRACVPTQAKYKFVIEDSYGDGICCDYGNGEYSVAIDFDPPEKARGGGDFDTEEEKILGTMCGGGLAHKDIAEA